MCISGGEYGRSTWKDTTTKEPASISCFKRRKSTRRGRWQSIQLYQERRIGPVGQCCSVHLLTTCNVCLTIHHNYDTGHVFCLGSTERTRPTSSPSKSIDGSFISGKTRPLSASPRKTLLYVYDAGDTTHAVKNKPQGRDDIKCQPETSVSRPHTSRKHKFNTNNYYESPKKPKNQIFW